jgi:hypothetical protein
MGAFGAPGSHLGAPRALAPRVKKEVVMGGAPAAPLVQKLGSWLTPGKNPTSALIEFTQHQKHRAGGSVDWSPTFTFSERLLDDATPMCVCTAQAGGRSATAEAVDKKTAKFLASEKLLLVICPEYVAASPQGARSNLGSTQRAAVPGAGRDADKVGTARPTSGLPVPPALPEVPTPPSALETSSEKYAAPPATRVAAISLLKPAEASSAAAPSALASVSDHDQAERGAGVPEMLPAPVTAAKSQPKDPQPLVPLDPQQEPVISQDEPDKHDIGSVTTASSSSQGTSTSQHHENPSVKVKSESNRSPKRADVAATEASGLLAPIPPPSSSRPLPPPPSRSTPHHGMSPSGPPQMQQHPRPSFPIAPQGGQPVQEAWRRQRQSPHSGPPMQSQSRPIMPPHMERLKQQQQQIQQQQIQQQQMQQQQMQQQQMQQQQMQQQQMQQQQWRRQQSVHQVPGQQFPMRPAPAIQRQQLLQQQRPRWPPSQAMASGRPAGPIGMGQQPPMPQGMMGQHPGQQGMVMQRPMANSMAPVTIGQRHMPPGIMMGQRAVPPNHMGQRPMSPNVGAWTQPPRMGMVPRPHMNQQMPHNFQAGGVRAQPPYAASQPSRPWRPIPSNSPETMMSTRHGIPAAPSFQSRAPAPAPITAAPPAAAPAAPPPAEPEEDDGPEDGEIIE